MAATYYVWSGAGGTGDGSSWTNAFTSIPNMMTASKPDADGDIVKIHYAHDDGTAAATRTYTFTVNCMLISVDKDSSDAYTAMGTNGFIGQSSGYAVTIAATNKTVSYEGITIRSGDTATARNIVLGGDGGSHILNNCRIRQGGGPGLVSIGTQDQQSYVRLINTTLSCYHTGSTISLNGDLDWAGGGIASDSAAITTLIGSGGTDPGGATASLHGLDLSSMSSTATLVATSTTNKTAITFSHCKLPSNPTYLGALTAQTQAYPEVWLYNCASGDVHYNIAHYNALGSTIVSAATYCNDNITDTNLSWYVSSTADATLYAPYISPWIDVYNSDTSTSVTPYLEGLRASDSDSACDTVAQDDEIWSEWSEQDTSSYPLATIVSDRMTPLGTAADQTSTKATTDWTIAAANDAYKSTFKLAAPAAFTPNEVGHVRARVCVGIASKGFFIDPQIRGLA